MKMSKSFKLNASVNELGFFIRNVQVLIGKQEYLGVRKVLWYLRLRILSGERDI